MHELYKALDKLGKGMDFLDHISSYWDDERQLEHTINALGGIRNWNNGMVDDDLMDEYVIDVYLNDMRYIDRNKEGRIILELMPGEEAEFFDSESGGRSYDCKDIAKQIFSDEGLDWESYDEGVSIEELKKTYLQKII